MNNHEKDETDEKESVEARLGVSRSGELRGLHRSSFETGARLMRAQVPFAYFVYFVVPQK
ncbi:MAG: hypothetical protein WDN28_02410 [Chthoniobacter sp.]